MRVLETFGAWARFFNSKKANDAFEAIGCSVFSIPPRSPDFNPIENIFNTIRSDLMKEAAAKQISRETFEEFSSRVKRAFEQFSHESIDNTIASMPNRMRLAKEAKGGRIRY